MEQEAPSFVVFKTEPLNRQQHISPKWGTNTRNEPRNTVRYEETRPTEKSFRSVDNKKDKQNQSSKKHRRAKSHKTSFELPSQNSTPIIYLYKDPKDLSITAEFQNSNLNSWKVRRNSNPSPKASEEPRQLLIKPESSNDIVEINKIRQKKHESLQQIQNLNSEIDKYVKH